MQSRNRDTDIENSVWIPRGKEEIEIDICTLLILYIKQITNENLLYSTAATWMGGKAKSGAAGICIADSLCSMVEADTIL